MLYKRILLIILVLFICIAVLMYLIVRFGSSNKSTEEILYELEAERNFIEKYNNSQK